MAVAGAALGELGFRGGSSAPSPGTSGSGTIPPRRVPGPGPTTGGGGSTTAGSGSTWVQGGGALTGGGIGGRKAVGTPAQAPRVAPPVSPPMISAPVPNATQSTPGSAIVVTPQAAPAPGQIAVLTSLGGNAFNLLASGQAHFVPFGPGAKQLVLNSTGLTPSGDSSAYVYSSAVTAQFPEYGG